VLVAPFRWRPWRPAPPGAGAFFRFWNGLALKVLSLAVPVLMWIHARSGRLLPDTGAARVS